MGSISLWIAMREKRYNELKNDSPDFSLTNVVGPDELYNILEAYGHGGGFVYDETFPLEWEDHPSYEWFSCDQTNLKIKRVRTSPDEDIEIGFSSAEAKRKWFSKYFDEFRKTMQNVLDTTTLESFSKYTVIDAAWRVKSVFNECWSGGVVIIDDNYLTGELETPMDFLRLMKPREKWVIAGKEWRYK